MKPIVYLWDTSCSSLSFVLYFIPFIPSNCRSVFVLNNPHSFMFVQALFTRDTSVRPLFSSLPSNQRRGEGPGGDAIGWKPPLASRFHKTGSAPEIWLMSFSVWNCANFKCLCFGSKGEIVRHIVFQLFVTFWCLRRARRCPDSRPRAPVCCVMYLEYMYIYILHFTYSTSQKQMGRDRRRTEGSVKLN